jgi:hypothetical protein
MRYYIGDLGFLSWVACNSGKFMISKIWMIKCRLYINSERYCDLFVMLFFTKVGKYTAEEFTTAFGSSKETNKPFIYTFFKDASITTDAANQENLMSLWAFLEKLKNIGHFQNTYKSAEDPLLQFG